MEIMQESKTVEALNNVYTYSQYRELIDRLLLENKTTGSNQSEGYVEYTRQNVHRMNRMDEWIEIPESISNVHNKPLRFVAISEAWCGDASQNLPVIAALVNRLPLVTLEIILRDEHVELMDKFLTNGGRAIPKLLIIEPSTNKVLASWGPRPKQAQDIVIEMKKNPDFNQQDMAKELFTWYAKDKGKSVLNELEELLSKLINI